MREAEANPFPVFSFFFFRYTHQKRKCSRQIFCPAQFQEDEAAGQSDLAQQDSPFMQSLRKKGASYLDGKTLEKLQRERKTKCLRGDFFFFPAGLHVALPNVVLLRCPFPV